jgi:hypothetical protein
MNNLTRYNKVLGITLCALFTTAVVLAKPAVKVVSFDDMKIKGLEGKVLPIRSCWGAIGIDPDDVVYVVFGTNRQGGVIEDCSVFMWDTKTGERKVLGSLRVKAKEQGTLAGNEPLPKGHTAMPYYNGKMFFGTQNFHEAGSGDDINTLMSRYHGSHIFSIDTKTHELFDESIYQTDNVFQRGQGFIAMAPMPWNKYVVGFSHPKGDLVLYNPDDHTRRIVKHDPDYLARPTRVVVPTSLGKIFTFHTGQKLGIYRIAEDKLEHNDQGTSMYFLNGRAISKDGRKVYLSDYRARFFTLDPVKETFKQIDAFGSTKVYALTMSLDEKKVYAMARNGICYEYNEETGKIISLVDLEALGEGGSFTGYNVTDSKGRIYFARFGGSIVQIDVSDRTGPSPYPAVSSKMNSEKLSVLRTTGAFQIRRYGNYFIVKPPASAAVSQWQATVYSMQGESLHRYHGTDSQIYLGRDDFGPGTYMVKLSGKGIYGTRMVTIP